MTDIRRRILCLTTFAGLAAGQTLTIQEKENFLMKAEVVTKTAVTKGVTGTTRYTLTLGGITHDASFQSIDQFQQVFNPAGAKAELNFKDNYKFNLAAWKLAKMIGLEHMVPPTVERKLGSAGALTWWIDDVLMDEGERLKQKGSVPPDALAWAREMAMLRMFDQLIHNNDRNVGNMVIDKSWHLWMIDHTRAFRANKTLPMPTYLSLVERGVLAKMKALDEATLLREMKNLLGKNEVQGILARRNLIVKAFEAKGPSVLFDLPATK
jgi:hypothetical protein